MATIKIEPDQILNAATEMQVRIAEARECMVRSAYVVNNNVDLCYYAKLMSLEPYTNYFQSALQEFERSIEELDRLMRCVDEYRKYLDDMLRPIPEPIRGPGAGQLFM